MKNEDIYESYKEYESIFDSFIEECMKRFSDFEKLNITLKLALHPQLDDVSEAPEEFQWRFLKCLKKISLFDHREDPTKIQKTVEEYPRLRGHERPLISCSYIILL